MQHIALFASIVLFLCSACQQQAAPTGCYQGYVGKDTVALHIQTDQGQVSGTLDYRLWEKDRNSGTVSGKVVGDSLLLLDYTFASEGTQSVRQVAFLMKDGNLVEGYGPVDEATGNSFTDIRQLSFSNSFVLKPVDCRQLP